MTINDAVQMYIDRKNRNGHPEGEFDNAGRWYPAQHEQCACCKYIRQPSRAYPYSLMVHCRTAEHIAHLTSIDAKLIKKLARVKN